MAAEAGRQYRGAPLSLWLRVRTRMRLLHMWLACRHGKNAMSCMSPAAWMRACAAATARGRSGDLPPQHSTAQHSQAPRRTLLQDVASKHLPGICVHVHQLSSAVSALPASLPAAKAPSPVRHAARHDRACTRSLIVTGRGGKSSTSTLQASCSTQPCTNARLWDVLHTCTMACWHACMRGALTDPLGAAG